MKKKIHFIFAGGPAVAASAGLAEEAGFEVSACEYLDPDSPFFKELDWSGVKTYSEKNKNHLGGTDLLVVSNATKNIDPENEEVSAAKEQRIEVLLAEEFLTKYLLTNKVVVAVAGTNGKSTTTAMLGEILIEAGADPSVFVGAMVPEWKRNFKAGKGKYFVLEADEYTDKFLLYHPDVEVITNIELDHPDYFKNLNQVRKSFEKFASNLKPGGKIFLGPEVELKANRQGQVPFNPVKFDLKIPGDFNQNNATLAYSTALSLGVNPEVAKKALEHFTGIGRRFEFKGEEKGVMVFDDYAHHPTAVRATLDAAREKFPAARIWCVFQPHTFSRLEVLFKDFLESLENSPADKIVLMEVFGSREQDGNVTSKDLARGFKKKEVQYLTSQDEAATYIAKNASFGDVILVMGAGDIYKLSPLILSKLENKE